MQTWTQVYDPLGNLWLSAAAALLPILFFFLALTRLRMKGHVAGVITVAIAFAVAVFLYKMPVGMALAATGYGFAYGLWPIAWIIVTSVFLYKVTVKTGQFEIIRSSILSITEDQRLQLILVGFAFGAFLEGAAGFGAPVAITAALLVGLGFNPLYAAGLCLIANTAPVAFGAMGIPITVAGKVTGIAAMEIGQMAGRQLPLLSLLIPFWLVLIMDGFKGIRQTWPALLVAGGSFGLTQFITANYIGPELPDITSALVSLLVLSVFLKFWKPKEIFRFTNQKMGSTPAGREAAAAKQSGGSYTAGQIFKAWSPFGVLTIMVTVWSLAPVKALFTKGHALYATVLNFNVPGLHNLVIKSAPIVNKPTPYEAIFKLDLLSATGTAILLAAILSMVILRMDIRSGLKTFGETVAELKKPIFSISMVLGFAMISNYSGLSSTLGLALAGTGAAFPFFSPFLGWLGVFLTGSDTSSNALFANLQAVTAHQIDVHATLLTAANTTGGVTGKMISPQSIAIACAAVGLAGRESDLFRFTVKHSLLFASVIGLITLLQAYVFPGMIP
jgi:L-lactate permease/lactate permease